ncbi:MAG: hypothetical protein JXA52_01250, partial [Planctomycetes bacterium]|nr:hypothetical protein [Planctomycetota bacterium]
ANQPGENAKNLIIDALYGKAWSFARLANTAGKERHRHYLGEASLALREVLADMPPEDPRYQAATYKYAESLVALGDYKQAQISLRDIINLPQYRMRANYLAGSAALLSARKTLEPQAYQEAYNYFNNAYQLAREAKIYDILLPSLHNLVAIELSRGRYEEAVSYSQEALEYAKTIRDVVATAKSQLDKARGLIALVQTIGEADEASMAASIPPPAFHALPEYNPEIMVTLEKDNETTSSLREQTPTELLLEAKQILEMLLGQHDVQNRLDETYYYQGCALFEEAKIKSREFAQSSAVLPLGKESLSVVNAFEKVDSAFDRSFSANPRGIFATRVHYAQAHVGRAAGILFQHIADRLLKQGDRKSAQIYRDRSLKQLVNARDALLRMLNLSSPPPEQHNAQALLGCVYQDLNRPLEAEQVFREFLKTPEAAPKLHTFATLRLVEVLEGRARIFDAVEVLSSYLAELSPVTVIIPSRDNAICTVILQLGAYQEEIGKLDAAYQTLLLFTRLPQSPEPAELQKQIEGNYRAHTLGMKLAQTLPSSKEPEDLVQASIQGLENISAQYPDSKWAALSLEAIAQHHLDSKDAARAMAVADLGLARLPKPASQLQMLLLKGKIFFTQKDYPSAIREYRSALELHPKAIAETRMLARNYLELAMALSAQAKLIMNAEEKQKTFEQAIDTFAAVWAKYPEEYTAADQSRIAAAEALKQAGRIEEAATILGGMYDKRRSANLQRRLTDLSEDTM